MKILLATITAAAALSFSPALGQTNGAQTNGDATEARGDAEAGATLFQRQCATCHVVQDDEGEILAGRPTRTGPNLYGVFGAEPGTQHDFNYSDALVAYGETGALWEHENLSSYLDDPTAHLREALDDPRARSQMVFRVRNEEQKHDIIAFIAEHGQQSPDDDEGEAEGETDNDTDEG